MNIEIICDTAQSTAFNMAADLYLMNTSIEKQCLYLRFYQWQQPTITIGYMQKPDALLNKDAMSASQIAWIRRPTGGRAVYHCNDITYSCTFPATFTSMGATITESYNILSHCLLTGLRNSGIICDTHDSDIELNLTKKDLKLPCFLAPNRNEIMFQHKKLVGSAQKRTTDAILQHGSIPLSPEYRNLSLFLNLSLEQQEKQIALLKEKTTCIEEILGEYEPEPIIQGLVNGFSQCLATTTNQRTWTEKEFKDICQLANSDTFYQEWLQ